MKTRLALALSVLAIDVGCSATNRGPDPSALTIDTGGKADGNGAFAPYHCPAGSRFATNGSDGMFCLYEGFMLPDTAVEPLCDLGAGYVGFAWGSSAVSYACPSPATEFGTSCRFAVTDAPRGAEPYCTYLASAHTVGYSWDLCPPGASRLSAGDTVSCTFTGLPVPAGASAYCGYVDRGYLGWSWTPAAGETATCPAGFRLAYNGSGDAFCLLENLALPYGLAIEAGCDHLDKGILSFSASPEASLPVGASGPTSWPVDGGVVGPSGFAVDGGGPVGPSGWPVDGGGPIGPSGFVVDGGGPVGPSGFAVDGGDVIDAGTVDAPVDAPTCTTCAVFLGQPWRSRDSMCPGSEALFEAYHQCLCVASCSDACRQDARCLQSSLDTYDGCSTCSDEWCWPQYDACANDTGG
jgi:hypothetical protein